MDTRTPRPRRIAEPRLAGVLRALLVPGLLLVAALVAGGLAGVILGFTALLLAIDRLLDRLGVATGAFDAERAFTRLAHERRRLERRAAGADGLAHLAEDTGWAAVSQRRALGLQAIAIDSIVGTVDRHKAIAFDAAFRPPAWSRGRWTLMAAAAHRGMPLPPISVYRVGGEHYVRDGHHRVSVARALGAIAIDAYVTELQPGRAAGHAAPQGTAGCSR